MNITTPNFDKHSHDAKLAAITLLEDLVLNDPATPEHQKISVRIIRAYKSLDKKLTETVRAGSVPYPDMGMSDRKFPDRRELLEYLQLMEEGLDSFLAAHPSFIIPPVSAGQ